MRLSFYCEDLAHKMNVDDWPSRYPDADLRQDPRQRWAWEINRVKENMRDPNTGALLGSFTTPATAEPDDMGVWLHGVEPGQAEALRAIRDAHRNICSYPIEPRKNWSEE